MILTSWLFPGLNLRDMSSYATLKIAMISITGGKIDTWLMQHVFRHACNFLVKTFGKTNFFWAQVAYVLGGILIVFGLIPNGSILDLAFLALIWGYNTYMLWFFTHILETDVTRSERTGTIPDGKSLIRMRITLLLVALLSLVFSILAGGPNYTLALGMLTQASGCFFATNIIPPGQSLLHKVKARLQEFLVRPAAAPMPVGA